MRSLNSLGIVHTSEEEVKEIRVGGAGVFTVATLRRSISTLQAKARDGRGEASARHFVSTATARTAHQDDGRVRLAGRPSSGFRHSGSDVQRPLHYSIARAWAVSIHRRFDTRAAAQASYRRIDLGVTRTPCDKEPISRLCDKFIAADSEQMCKARTHRLRNDPRDSSGQAFVITLIIPICHSASSSSDIASQQAIL